LPGQKWLQRHTEISAPKRRAFLRSHGYRAEKKCDKQLAKPPQ
jgi:hypothetical protein